MRKKIIGLLAVTLAGILLLAGCGSSTNTTSAPEQETATTVSRTAAETVSTEDAGVAAETASVEKEASAQEVHPYAWLGLQDIPECRYLDIMASAHFIQTYDAYVMSFVTEETEAVDGTNTYKESGDDRTYSVDGKVLSLDVGAKKYMEQNIGSLAGAAKQRLESARASGDNIYGRRFLEKGSGSVPKYEDSGDKAEYEYYEYDYPATEEATGSTIHERFYMKDGDVFAIYKKTTTSSTELESVQVIKSISSDIPEGTFDLPDLDGYEKY